jgi:type VI secretion system protein ImpC
MTVTQTQTQTKTADAPSTSTTELALLDQVLAATTYERDDDTIRRALGLVFEQAVNRPERSLPRPLFDEIALAVAAIDDGINAQLNEIVHDPEYQRLEGTWSGVCDLVEKAETPDVRFRLLHATLDDLETDRTQSGGDLHASHLYDVAVRREFGTIGGMPNEAMIFAYEFGPANLPLMSHLGKVAQGGQAMLYAGASPQLLGLDSWAKLPRNPSEVRQLGAAEALASWRDLRGEDHVRHLNLVGPRDVARAPYNSLPKTHSESNNAPGAEFFNEDISGPNDAKVLYRNGVFTYATCLALAEGRNGLPCGCTGRSSGGSVKGRPRVRLPADANRYQITEVQVDDALEKVLAELGMIVPVHVKGTSELVYYDAVSAFCPPEMSDPSSAADQRLSADTQAFAVTCRFGQYMRVMLRDTLGGFLTGEEIEASLNDWLMRYKLGTPESAGPVLRAQRPLRDGKVQVTPVVGHPGHYELLLTLTPHYRVKSVQVYLKLQAETRNQQQ